MPLQQLTGLLLSRRLDSILSKTRVIRASGAVASIRNQSTEARPRLDSAQLNEANTVRNWAKVYPFLPTKPTVSSAITLLEHDRDRMLKNSNLMAVVEDRQVFIENYLSHELSLDKEKVNGIYFLCQKEMNQHYPNNEAIIQLCNFLKLFFTSDDLYYNLKPFTMPFSVLCNRYILITIFIVHSSKTLIIHFIIQDNDSERTRVSHI